MVITDMRMEHETAGYDVIRAARKQTYNPATAILDRVSFAGHPTGTARERSRCW